MRRHSPSLVVTLKDTDRVAPSSEAVHHRLPWNKYGARQGQALAKVQVELSQPSKDEFVRIRNWAQERRRFEERQASLAEQRQSLLARRQMETMEATQRAKRSALLEEIERGREKRREMQLQRTLAQDRYLAFRHTARQTPLLHEIRQNAFHEVRALLFFYSNGAEITSRLQELKRSESARLELYNAKVKPFRTVRPRQIMETNVLRELGKRREVKENDVLSLTAGKEWHRRARSLPPPSLRKQTTTKTAVIQKKEAATETELDDSRLLDTSERSADKAATPSEKNHSRDDVVSSVVEETRAIEAETLDKIDDSAAAYQISTDDANEEPVKCTNDVTEQTASTDLTTNELPTRAADDFPVAVHFAGPPLEEKIPAEETAYEDAGPTGEEEEGAHAEAPLSNEHDPAT